MPFWEKAGISPLIHFTIHLDLSLVEVPFHNIHFVLDKVVPDSWTQGLGSFLLAIKNKK